MRKVHGIISLTMLMVSFIVGLYAVITASLNAGILYAVLLLLLPMIVIYSFCAKCSCKSEGCGHVLPGKIAGFMPDRRGQKYSGRDMAGVIIPFLILVVFPQPWLYANIVLPVIFWIVLAVSLAYIRLYVCIGCENTECPFCKDIHEGGAIAR